MALIYSVFPPEKRVQALGWWSTVMAGGPVLGVVAGGPLVEAFGWRWIFVIQVPLTILGVLVAGRGDLWAYGDRRAMDGAAPSR